MNRPNVICLGEALVDRLGPLGGKTAFDKPFNDCLGGAPANVACGLARLGINVAFIGCVGNDSIGDQFKNLFASRGVNIEGLQVNENFPTRIVLVQRDLNGERSFGGFWGDQSNSFADQALDLTQVKNIWPLLIRETSWVLMGTIPLAFEDTRAVALWTIDQALKHGIKIAIDLNWRPVFWDTSVTPNSPPNKEVISLTRSFLDNASLLKLAKEEAIWFFDSEDPREISDSLSEKPSVIITDGSNPIKWFIGEFVGITSVLSPSKIIDTTGAGDSFMAGMISQILSYSIPKNHIQAESMIQFAAACGALVCKGAGAISPQPITSEVKNFLSSDL